MRVGTSFIHAGKRSCVTYFVPVVVVVVVGRRRRRQPYIDENRCIPRVSVPFAGPLAAFNCLLFPRQMLAQDKLKCRDTCRSDFVSRHRTSRPACIACVPFAEGGVCALRRYPPYFPRGRPVGRPWDMVDINHRPLMNK